MPHPDWTVALHVLASNAVVATVVPMYTVWVAWSTNASNGAAPTSTVGGSVVGHPARSVAVQVALLIIETVVLSPAPLSEFGTYTVWLAGSTYRPIGYSPTGTVAGVCPHPDVFIALHVAPLNTDTASSPTLVT